MVTDRQRRYAQPLQSSGAKAAMAQLIARICVLAAAVDAFYLLFFGVIGATLLAWINVVSIGLYALAYASVQRHRLRPAVFLIWLEAFPHAVIGTLMLGWASGFHNLLLMFVPAVIISSPRRLGMAFVLAMTVFLSSLLAISLYLGPLAPIADHHLQFLGWANFVLFVAMFSGTADYYRGKLVKAERELQSLATTDPLTGLSNRRHFEQMAEAALARARRAGSAYCVAILDIDRFKSINDSHGHHVGDRVLVAVSETLRTCVRETDLLARWGGEEFVLLMPDTLAEGALALAERIRDAVEAGAMPHAGSVIRFTLSAGLTQAQANDDLDAALTRADKALYRSKESGRNRVTAAE